MSELRADEVAELDPYNVRGNPVKNAAQQVLKDDNETEELLPEYIQREEDAWKEVLGAEVEVEPLPEYVTPEVIDKFHHYGMDLFYLPALFTPDVVDSNVGKFLKKLQQKYPNWTTSLNPTDQADYKITRNIELVFWELVRTGAIPFPQLPGQWMAVETIEKPDLGKPYKEISAGIEVINYLDLDRRDLSWDTIDKAIRVKGRSVKEALNLFAKPAEVRLLEPIEWNLLGNRLGWGKTNKHEWTNTMLKAKNDIGAIAIGGSDAGLFRIYEKNNIPIPGIGYRLAVVLGGVDE